MNTNELHPIQLQILKKLMFSSGLTYTRMKPDKGMGNNQFQYHIGKLLEDSLIQKTEKLYALTDLGKTVVSTIDYSSLNFIKQSKIHVSLCARRELGGEPEYLLYTRTKHPYFGGQGFPSGKLDRGETTVDGATREFYEETNLNGIPKLKAIFHTIIHAENSNSIIDDLMLYVFRFDNPTGELKQGEEGKYEWVKFSEIDEFIKHPFADKKKFMEELLIIESSVNEVIYKESVLTDKKTF